MMDIGHSFSSERRAEKNSSYYETKQKTPPKPNKQKKKRKRKKRHKPNHSTQISLEQEIGVSAPWRKYSAPSRLRLAKESVFQISKPVR